MRVILLLLGYGLVAGAWYAGAQEEPPFPEELQATYENYCLPFERDSWTVAAWNAVFAGAETLASDEQGKAAMLEMAAGTNFVAVLCSTHMLSQVNEPRLVPIVMPHVMDTSQTPDARAASSELIEGWAGPKALPAMLAVLAEPKVDAEKNSLRRCAIHTLGSIDEDAARSRLRELVDDPDYQWCQLVVIESLGRLRDTAAVPQLVAIARRTGAQHASRAAAALALAEIGNPESIVPLLEVVRDTPLEGRWRWSVGIAMKNSLRSAQEETQDQSFRADLQELIDSILALATERPVG